MGARTDSYQHQCRELLRLARTISLEASQGDAHGAKRGLEELRSILTVHVRLQNGILHPWLQKDGPEHLRDGAKGLALTGSDLLNSIVTFTGRWRTGDAIAARRPAFAAEFGELARRLQTLVSEEQALYYGIDDHDGVLV